MKFWVQKENKCTELLKMLEKAIGDDTRWQLRGYDIVNEW